MCYGQRRRLRPFFSSSTLFFFPPASFESTNRNAHAPSVPMSGPIIPVDTPALSFLGGDGGDCGEGGGDGGSGGAGGPKIVNTSSSTNTSNAVVSSARCVSCDFRVVPRRREFWT